MSSRSIQTITALKPKDSYVTKDLREKLTKDKISTFTPYMVGGSGYKYTITDIELLEQLHKKGWEIDTGIVSKTQDTALHIACLHENPAMIEFLLRMGANIKAENYRGQKPFDFVSPKILRSVEFF